MDMEIIQLPQRREPRTLSRGWRAWQRVVRMVRRGAHGLGLPGMVRPMSVEDALTGRRVSVTVGPDVVTLAVDGSGWQFGRWSGRYLGSYTSCG
jgi:hypothetical protein